jgi:hypothetical protein
VHAAVPGSHLQVREALIQQFAFERFPVHKTSGNAHDLAPARLQ